ncbi:MAG: hypothetical protein NZ455_04100 [Bacteroidia bacterium]|nr:hypothetical protein [Bacteroidia bacterium]MDW8348413.1 hypothetical protein [Bacteroidia bacterium]
MRKIVFTLFFCIIYIFIHAQYAITEIGVAAGPGYNYPLRFGIKKVKGHVGLQANVFCSRYFCGKKYGFHAFAGYRGFSRFTADFQDTAIKINADVRFHYAEAGLLFKIRKEKFNRPRESAFLIGPVLDILFLERNKGIVSGEGRTFLLGIMASGWMRREYKRKAFFIQPGVQAMLVPFLKGNAQFGFPFETRWLTLYPFISLAYSFKTIRG